MIPGRVLAVLAPALAVAALAACKPLQACSSDAQCDAHEEACRPTATYCVGYPDVAVLSRGYCRGFGAACASADDCPPSQRCRSDGVCVDDPGLCKSGPSAADCQAIGADCQPVTPYPCACVCPACPAPDAGA